MVCLGDPVPSSQLGALPLVATLPVVSKAVHTVIAVGWRMASLVCRESRETERVRERGGGTHAVADTEVRTVRTRLYSIHTVSTGRSVYLMLVHVS